MLLLETNSSLVAEHSLYLENNTSSLVDRGWSSLSLEVSASEFSISSFYQPLIGSGDGNVPDILISYLHEGTDEDQIYVPYFVSRSEDLSYLLDDLEKDRGLVFQGSHRPHVHRDGSIVYNSHSSTMRFLFSICVDVDPATDPSDGLKHPLYSSSCLSYFLDNVPDEISPSYIVLSGSGFHLWYFFESPVACFSKGTLRREKLSLIQKGLYQCVYSLMDGFPVEIDMRSRNLYHPFCAPGSLSKFGDQIPCFCDSKINFKERFFNPNNLFSSLQDLLGASFNVDPSKRNADLLLSPEELSAAWNKLNSSGRSKPPTQKQLDMITWLIDEDFVPSSKIVPFEELNVRSASELISSYFPRRKSYEGRDVPDKYMTWSVKPHVLQSGKTGGVYQTILNSVPFVPVGHRYSTLNMLAGVAYMMVNPTVPVSKVRSDFMRLIASPWGRKGTPLTVRDVENALKGYCPENWQTLSTEIEAMGFSPFKGPAKRNNKTRAEHLDKLHADMRNKTVNSIVEFLEENPGSKKTTIAKALGINVSTVYRNWEEVMKRVTLLSRSSLPASAFKLLNFLADNPDASKSEATRGTGLSPNTVAKYWQVVKEELESFH